MCRFLFCSLKTKTTKLSNLGLNILTCSGTFATRLLTITKENPGAATEMYLQRKHFKYSSIKSKGDLFHSYLVWQK